MLEEGTVWYEVENISLVGWGHIFKHLSIYLVDELILHSAGNIQGF